MYILMRKFGILIGLLFPFISLAQDCSKVNKKAVKRLKIDVSTLASDQMEGREPGTSGEIKARDYIVGRMEEIGLSPKGTNGFVQDFWYFENVKQKPNNTKLTINNKLIRLNHEFYPVNLSSNGVITDVPVLSVAHGIHLPDEEYSDYERLDLQVNGYIVQLDISNPKNIEFELPNLFERAIEARDRGAVALLLYSSQKGVDLPISNFKRIEKIGIPVVFLKSSVFAKVPVEYLENASLSISQYEVPTKAHNVIGILDNGAEYTVAIMGHYDHLGYGGEGSHYKGPRKIHNGADDNASGTAAVLELAHYFVNNKPTEKYNYLFIAFSAEEKGLLGSQYFVQNPTISLSELNFALNMDMVGRMEGNMDLTIEGTGSVLLWEAYLKEVSCDAFPLKLKKRENGPSDHRAFYNSGVPALHFWTGKHNDYHKPSDDVEKINFVAESQIISFIELFLLTMDEKEKVTFHLRKK
jgi:aminopeptidase YwaD